MNASTCLNRNHLTPKMLHISVAHQWAYTLAVANLIMGVAQMLTCSAHL